MKWTRLSDAIWRLDEGNSIIANLYLNENDDWELYIKHTREPIKLELPEYDTKDMTEYASLAISVARPKIVTAFLNMALEVMKSDI